MTQREKEKLKIKAYEIILMINTAKNRTKKRTEEDFLTITKAVEYANLQRFFSDLFIIAWLNVSKSTWRFFKSRFTEKIFLDIQNNSEG